MSAAKVEKSALECRMNHDEDEKTTSLLGGSKTLIVMASRILSVVSAGSNAKSLTF